MRVWDHVRTAQQIRAGLFSKMTGKEPGLMALWNFDDPKRPAKDATGNLPDGQMYGNARVVKAQLPASHTEEGMETVLQLDGDGDFMELPPNILNELREATVEGWVKWDALGNWSRFFNYGKATYEVNITLRQATSDLQVEIRTDGNEGPTHTIVVRDMVRVGEWCHIALVTGADGVRLYFTANSG